MAENSIIDYSNIIGDDGSFKKLFSYLDDLEKRLETITKNYRDGLELINPNDTKAINEAEKAIRKYEKAQENINEQRKVAIKQRKQLNDLTQEELINREAEKLANRERVQRAKQLAIIRKEEKNNIASLRAQLSLVTLDWKKLTAEETENGKEGRKLVKQKKDLTAQLKRLEKATGDNRREVGNYTNATKGLGSTLKRLFVGRTIADGILRIGGALADVIEKNKDTNAELGKLSQTFEIVKNVAEDVAVAFLELVASPISDFLLNLAFAVDKIRTFFSQAGESSKEFKVVLNALGTAFDFVLRPVKLLFGFISDFPAIIGGTINVFREFGSIASGTFTNLALRAEIAFFKIERGLKSIAGVDVTDLDNRITNLTTALRANQEAGEGLFDAYNRGYEDVKQQQEAFNAAQAERLKDQENEKDNEKAKGNIIKTQNKALEEQKRLINEINTSTNKRLEIIEQLQKDIEAAEIDNIEDRQAKLLALEDKKEKELQAQRESNFSLFISNIEQQENTLIKIYGDNSKEVLEFREQAGKEILEVEKLNQTLEAEQLEASEKKKIEIRKKFALETIEIETISVLNSNDETAKPLDEKVQLIEDSNDKAKKSNDKFFDDLIKSSEKVANLVNDQFKKTTEAATDAVESQAKAVETQRERAEQGLANTLKFEEEELARKEAERLRSEKRQQNAAKILALYSLVAAYAQSGDEQALQRAFASFAALEVATGVLQGFYEGTENIGESLGDNSKAFNTGKDDYLGRTKKGTYFRFDGSERIVNGSDNQKLKGMSNKELVNNAILGMSISDNNSNLQYEYEKQYKDVKKAVSTPNNSNYNLSVLVNEMRATRKAIQNKPTSDFDILKVTDTMIEIAKKTVKNQMTRTERIKKRM